MRAKTISQTDDDERSQYIMQPTLDARVNNFTPTSITPAAKRSGGVGGGGGGGGSRSERENKGERSRNTGGTETTQTSQTELKYTAHSTLFLSAVQAGRMNNRLQKRHRGSLLVS